MKANPDHIKAHLRLLSKRASPDSQVELNAVDPDGNWFTAKFKCSEAGIQEAMPWAEVKNLEGCNVYVGKNMRKAGWQGKFGTDKDVEAAYNIVADLDSPESAEIIRNKSLPLPYHWVVVTGTTPNTRGHIYYELDEPMRNMDSYRQIQEAVRFRAKGDPIADPRRIVRLAGTVNYPTEAKKAKGYKTELTYLKTFFDERDPVSPEDLRIAFVPFDDPVTDLSPTPVEVPRTNGSGLGLVPPRVKDPDAAVEARIAANDNWDNAVTKMVARLMTDGLSAEEVIDKAAAAYTTDGYTLEQTRREVSAKVRRVTKKYETGQWVRPELKVVPGETDEIVDLGIRPVGLLQPMLRKKREFLVPNRFMRKHVTLTSAAPGVGKSTLAIEEAIALVSGRDFLNLGFDETKPMRAAIINNEETSDEIERRIEATCQCFDVPLESIAENLFVRSGVDAEKLVAARMIDGEVVATPHRRALKQFVQDAQLDLLIIDPFVQSHAVSENANEAVSRAMVLLRECVVGDEHSAALNLVHHIRKPPGGLRTSPDDMMVARGAGSMLGEAHFVFNLTDMSKRDAEEMGVEEDDLRSYLRLDDAKTKMGPPNDARWFERHGEDMVRTFGVEEIGVLIPWVPDVTDGKATVADKKKLLQMIDKRHKDGNPLTQKEDRDVKKLAVKLLKLKKKMVRDLITEWKEKEVIGTVRVDTGKKRLQGLGLTEKGRKLLENYANSGDAK